MNRLKKMIQSIFAVAHVAVLCVITMSSSAYAQGRCSDLGPINALVSDLQQMNWGEISVSRTTWLNLRRDVGIVENSSFLVGLQQENNTADIRVAQRFLKEARTVVTSNGIADRERLQTVIRDFKVLVQKICGKSSNASQSMSAQSERNTSKNSSKTAILLDEWWHANGAFTQVSAVFLFLLTLVGLVLLAHYAFSVTYGYVYNRKTCRVKSNISFGETKVAGYIVVLGRNGCRFEPEQPLDAHAIKQLLALGQPKINVLDFTLPAVLNGVAETYLSIFFESPTSLANLNQIFKKSTCTPIYRRKDIMKPNLDMLQSL